MTLWDRFTGAAAGLARLVAGGGDDDAATRRITFTIGVIALSAKMAKADGTVTADEVDAFRDIFAVPPQEFKNVSRVYDLARRDTAGFETYARQIARLFDEGSVVLEDLLEALFHIARADGHVSDDEMAFLHRVSEIFGFTEACFARIAARHVGNERSDPHAVLGVSVDVSDTELLRVYRALVRENHPDRLIGLGLPREFIAVANDRLASINAAYDRIAAQRTLLRD